MQALKNLKFHCLARCPYDDITGCNFNATIANPKAFPPSSRELHANVELVIVADLATPALPCAGVAHRLDNPGSGEVMLFDVGVERSRKAMWDLPLAVAGTKH